MTPQKRLVFIYCLIALFVITAIRLYLVHKWTTEAQADGGRVTMRAFTPLGCLPGPQGRAEYGFTRDLGPRDRMTVLSIPNNARLPMHYDSACAPLALRIAPEWSSGPSGQTMRGILSAAGYVRFDPAPLMTLTTDGRTVQGYAYGAAPPMSPGVPSSDPRQILVSLHNDDMGAMHVSSLIQSMKTAAANRGLGDFTRSGRVEIGLTGVTRRFYTGLFNERRLSEQLSQVSHYFGECDERGLCRLLAPLDNTNGPSNIEHMLLDVWISESHMPHARAVLLQLQRLLLSATELRPVK